MGFARVLTGKEQAIMEAEEIVTRTAKVRLEEGGIVRATVLPGAVQTLADAIENTAAEVKLTKGERYALLVDMRQIRSQDREARQYYTRPGCEKTLRAVAIVIASPMSRVIGNFFIGFGTRSVPNRLFTSETEAMEWLKSFGDG